MGFSLGRRDMVDKVKVPSLVDLCVHVAIDNVRYLGDVGETDHHLLDRILPHCTLDQLMHIENSTKDRDLTPVTDKLWKKFYKNQFGAESANVVTERMKQRKVTFIWKQLYEAKLQEREELTQKSLDRLKQLYQEENAKKQSRQVKLCTKTPPSSNKRSFFGGPMANNIYNTKSSLLKKAKLDVIKSREFQNIAALKNKTVHRNSIAALNNKTVHRNSSVSSIRKPTISPPSSSLAPKLCRPMAQKR